MHSHGNKPFADSYTETDHMEGSGRSQQSLVSLGVKPSLRFEKVKSYLVTPKFGLKVGGYLKNKEKVKRKENSIQYPLPTP